MADRRYYLDDFCDEIMPADGTLDDWARWLSEPDRQWGRKEAAADGAVFVASVIRFEADIVARRSPDGWTFDREPGDASLVAVRFGPGLGWQADNIVYPSDGRTMGEALREWFDENDADCDDVEHVAIGFDEPKVSLTFRASGPSLSIGEVGHG